MTLFCSISSLTKQGADRFSTGVLSTMNNNKFGRKRKLRREDEFLFVKMKLRLGLLLEKLNSVLNSN